MDGVLADFNKDFLKIKDGSEDRIRFRNAVMQYKIFETLDFMPDAHELLNHIKKMKDIDVEILTSMGTFNLEQGQEAKRQKLLWLNKHGITYKPNFVRTKTEKAQYATPKSILIDDSVGCVAPFIRVGGHAIQHINATDTIRILDSTVLHIRALDALRYE